MAERSRFHQSPTFDPGFAIDRKPVPGGGIIVGPNTGTSAPAGVASPVPTPNTGPAPTFNFTNPLGADFGGFGIPNSPLSTQALQTLSNILFGQGATSPALLNRDLADISQTTASTQQAAAGNAARTGLQGSGIAEALQSAIGVSGGEQRADRLAAETAAQEQRMREDLMLFLQLFVNPSIEGQALATGQFNADRARRDQRRASDQDAIFDVIENVIELYNNRGQGGGGISFGSGSGSQGGGAIPGLPGSNA